MGRLAEGDAFFDREEILGRAWDLLKTSNLLLLAPRRVGKSSLLNRMRADGASRGYKTLYLSVPDAEDELDFIKRLVRAFQDIDWGGNGWVEKFKRNLPEELELVLKTSLVELKAKRFDWRRPAEQLEAILKDGDSNTVLLIDELPLLIGSIVHEDPEGRRAERFLLWLKRLREQYPPRWFFAGSIGLDSVARKLKLSGTIHDLQPIELGAFSAAKARNYLIGRGNFYGWHLSENTIDAILDAVEWPIPFHLNLLFEELRMAVSDGLGDPSPELVEEAIRRLMMNGRTHFDHWDERLAKLMDPHFQRYSELILSVVCREAQGVQITTIDLRMSQEVTDDRSRAQLVRQLFDLLIGDGYLVRNQDSIRFRSSLLRRYWMETQG